MKHTHYTILRETSELEPKNPHISHDNYDEHQWKMFGEEETFLHEAFEAWKKYNRIPADLSTFSADLTDVEIEDVRINEKVHDTAQQKWVSPNFESLSVLKNKGFKTIKIAIYSPKNEDIQQYLLFREIQSNSFQDREVFVKWLNENYKIVKL